MQHPDWATSKRSSFVLAIGAGAELPMVYLCITGDDHAGNGCLGIAVRVFRGLVLFAKERERLNDGVKAESSRERPEPFYARKQQRPDEREPAGQAAAVHVNYHYCNLPRSAANNLHLSWNNNRGRTTDDSIAAARPLCLEVVNLAHLQPAVDYSQSASPSKGSWLSRVSHRASHIPNRPATSSREDLPLRTAASAGFASSDYLDYLPILQRTNSYPGTPEDNPSSPTETEFGVTPIDASFGERLHPPPARPAPERPSTSDRSSLPSQRTRSESTTQADQDMDKYARQAGDEAYDSDGGEADDEFERSVITSPTIPENYDDDMSDHPSESEEERGSMNGEETPTTQGWTERDIRSPTGNIIQWTEEQVADYISSLSPSLKQYSQAFAEEAVNGEALIALHHDELKELGISSVGHRLTILKAVYEQKLRAGIKIEEGDYVPLSAEADKGELMATQDDIARVIESIRLRDQRIIAAESALRTLKYDLERITEDNRKLREETLPVMRLVKDQRTPLPDPSMPSPRDIDNSKSSEALAPVKESKGSSLSRKFSTKKLFLGGAPKQISPTYPPVSHTPQPREVRDDGGTHLEASAAALAASSHLTASMTSQTSPNSVHGQQISPTSPAYTIGPSSGGSYHQPGSAGRSFPRDGSQSARHDTRGHTHLDDPSGYGSGWSQTSTDQSSTRLQERSKRQQNASPRDDEPPQTAPLPRERNRDRGGDGGDRDNPQVEIFKSFRVSIEDPCRVVLPVALKRYNIADDWRQYALYIVHGDQERCLGLEEKPLMLFKQLDKEGRKPMFMLRRHASPQEGWSGAASVNGGGGGQGGGGGAGQGGGGDGGKQIPGGVL